MDELARILSNPVVMKYSPREPIPKERVKQVTQEILQFFIPHWQHHDFCVWVVVEKPTLN
ncbi:MAG: hypothetical protein PUP90_11845 [Nostoc sp. S4]|nr:hypothetical protein [Nostoc sp. S4]